MSASTMDAYGPPRSVPERDLPARWVASGPTAILRKKWCPQVVIALAAESSRFNQLKRSLPGIASKPLSECLKQLRRWGIVTAGPRPATGVQGGESNLYSLTRSGRDLAAALALIADWAREMERPAGSDD